jgi:hypothetical protein
MIKKKKKTEMTSCFESPYRNPDGPFAEVVVPPKKEKKPMNRSVKYGMITFSIIPLLIPLLYAYGMLHMYWDTLNSPNAAALTGIAGLVGVGYIAAALTSFCYWRDVMEGKA